MKKKLMIGFAFCFAFGLTSFKAAENVVLEDGRSSECASYARGAIHDISDAAGDDPNGKHLDFYLEVYMELYTSCLR
jgi:hypothetical protein